MISEEEERRGRLLPINSLLILSSINFERRMNMKRILEITNIPELRAKATVEKLVESGLLEATGQGKNRNYILSAKLYKASKNELGYVRQTDIDKVRYEELILKLARTKNDGIARKEVVQLLNISKDQAYRLLKRLIDEEKLIAVGRGSGTKYKEKN